MIRSICANCGRTNIGKQISCLACHTPLGTEVASARRAIIQPEQQESGDSRPKFCTGCGNPLEPTVKFCTQCGQAVAERVRDSQEVNG